MSSKIAVSSATQFHGDDMDVDSDVMSPQQHDHPYYTPHQVAENVVGSVQESEKEGRKGTYTPLNTIKIEPVTPSPENSPDGINLSQSQSSPTHASHHQAAREPQGRGSPDMENRVVSSPESSPHGVTYSQNQTAGQPDDKGFTYTDSKAILGLILKIHVTNVPYNVSHDDLIKALSQYDEKVSVRTMRKVIPCLRITDYMRETEYIGKKKIKGLWAKQPDDWPEGVPYKDPNNGEKIDGKLVPKANSEELRAMFSFLKQKFVKNLRDQISQMSQDELEAVKGTTTKYTVEYDFSAHPRPTVVKKICVPQPAVKKELQARQGAEVKQETPSLANVTPAPVSDTAIPVCVTDFYTSSPEADIENSESKQIYAVETDASQIDIELDPNKLVQYIDEEGKVYFVQLTSSSPSSIDSDTSSENTGPETVIDTHEANVQDNRPQSLKRQHPVEEEMQSNETSSPVVVSGKRVREMEEQEEKEETSTTRSRGPVEQVSSTQMADVSPSTPNVTETPKATVEVAPQIRAQQVPIPQPVQPQSTVIPTPSVLPPPSPFNPSVIPIFPQSPVSMPGAAPTYMGDARVKLINDLHARAREKVSSLQTMTLGDVDLSMKLNELYKMIWLHYQNALKEGKPTTFIDAVHGCEALVERAIMYGGEFPRSEFLEQCDSLIQQYKHEEDSRKVTVMRVEQPENPPVQSDSSVLQQVMSPGWLDPKSPGTALSKQMRDLDLDKSQPAIDFNDWGIRTKADRAELEKLMSILEPRKQNDMQNVDPENLLPLPEKLKAMNVEADPNVLSQEQMDDLLQQLKQLEEDCNGLAKKDTEYTFDEDSRAVDLKQSQAQPEAEVTTQAEENPQLIPNNVVSQSLAHTVNQETTQGMNYAEQSQSQSSNFSIVAVEVESKPCGPSTEVITGGSNTAQNVPPSTQILSIVSNGVPAAMTPVTQSMPPVIPEFQSGSVNFITAPQGFDPSPTVNSSPGAPSVNNPIINKGSWQAAKEQMNTAMEEDTKGMFDTDELIDDVIGLENDYEHFEAYYKPKSSCRTTTAKSVQPSTPDDIGGFQMTLEKNGAQQRPNNYLMSLIAQNKSQTQTFISTQQPTQQSTAPPPYETPPQSVITVNIPHAVNEQGHNKEFVTLATLLQGIVTHVPNSSEVGMVVQGAGVNPAIPEVVTNYESVECEEEEMKPAPRGRKRMRKDDSSKNLY